MKTQDQIQMAHDQLIAAILKEPDLGFSQHQREVMHQLCKALCWVLEDNDEHAAQLDFLLRQIEAKARARGFKLHCPSKN